MAWDGILPKSSKRGHAIKQAPLSICYERKCQAPHFEHIGETWIFIFKIYVR